MLNEWRDIEWLSAEAEAKRLNIISYFTTSRSKQGENKSIYT